MAADPRRVKPFSIGTLEFADMRDLPRGVKDKTGAVAREAFSELMVMLGRRDFTRICETSDVEERRGMGAKYFEALKLNPSLRYSDFVASQRPTLEDWEFDERRRGVVLGCRHAPPGRILGTFTLFNVDVIRLRPLRVVSAMAAPFIKAGPAETFHRRMSRMLAWFLANDLELDDGTPLRVRTWRFPVQHPQYRWPVSYPEYVEALSRVANVTTVTRGGVEVLRSATRR